MSRHISIHVGQCGIQVGLSMWRRLMREHGIRPDGTAEDLDNSVNECRECFFDVADDGRYLPRAFFVDLEPGLFKRLTANYSIFDNDCFFHGIEGDMAGAGNKWATGYKKGNEVWRALEKQLRWVYTYFQGDADAFYVTHSAIGGTGSGLGSYVIEQLAQTWPSVPIITHTLFPSKESDVVTGYINAAFTTARLIDHAAMTVVYDNAALALATDEDGAGADGDSTKGFALQNDLIARVICDMTSGMRFASGGASNTKELLAQTVVDPLRKFIVPHEAPIGGDEAGIITNAQDVIQQLFEGQTALADIDSTTATHLSSTIILRGDMSMLYEEEHAAATYIRAVQASIHSPVRFAHRPGRPFQPPLIELCHQSPHDGKAFERTGLMLSNTTAVVSNSRVFRTGVIDLLLDKIKAGPKSSIPFFEEDTDISVTRETLEEARDRVRVELTETYLEEGQ
ncbi:Tubulin [Carpediemonas membranifera]|uniref:Tubulin n=1 Tax=Carpediemonas membranifera TaxID=201153 RepID=A0A8J6AU62_9EUKA|nr:Tubulin [Carpediemonas membranifera]|eukprot:KAG9394273.1 Tubulin [Carpediemonas membranifera]